ncbi:MAG: hypothetical protein ACRDHW_22200, partial [Ktedonobacteraceae bacterium]
SWHETERSNQEKNNAEDQSNGLIDICHGFSASFRFKDTNQKTIWITLHPNRQNIRMFRGNPGMRGFSYLIIARSVFFQR